MGGVGGGEGVCRGVEAEGQRLVQVTLHRPSSKLQVGEQEVGGAGSDKRKSLDFHC